MNLNKDQKKILFYALSLYEAKRKISKEDLAVVNKILDHVIVNDNACRELLISSKNGISSEMTSKMEKKLDHASLTFEKDDTILGGIKIKNCNVLIDASVNSLLNSLKDKLEDSK